jgi:hypothetical protein
VKNGCDYYSNATIIAEKIGRSLFVFIAIIRITQKCGSMSTERRGVTKLWILKGIFLSYNITHH